MLDTKENIHDTIKEWDKLLKQDGITEETIMSHEYDYLEEDNEQEEE